MSEVSAQQKAHLQIKVEKYGPSTYYLDRSLVELLSKQGLQTLAFSFRFRSANWLSESTHIDCILNISSIRFVCRPILIVPSVFLLYGCVCQLGIKENDDDDDDDDDAFCEV